jgi:hypothetical protein
MTVDSPKAQLSSGEAALDRGAHARGVDEFLGVMIDLPSLASPVRVTVKAVSLNYGSRWRR